MNKEFIMTSLYSFRLFVLSILLVAGVAPMAGRDYLSFGLLVLVTALIFWFSMSQAKLKRLSATQTRKTGRELMWKRLSTNKNAMAGMVVLIILIYLGILAPFISPCDPFDTDWGALSQGISKAHWLGTDDMGRDIFARNLFGIRVALGIGVTAVVLNTLIGTFLGLVAGYFGGKADNIIMRALEVWNAIPFILLAIAIMAALGTGIGKLILIVSLSNLMAFARIIRGSVLLVRESD